MIDFVLTENDQKILDHVRAEALVCRNYARHYDEHEEEFAPDELPEAKDFPDMGSLFMGRTEADTSMPIMTMLISAGQCWGDYTVRMRRGKGGLGNAALRAAGTPEQQEKWKDLTLAMAITEPGCGSDPSQAQTTAGLDEGTDERVINGEKKWTTNGGVADISEAALDFTREQLAEAGIEVGYGGNLQSQPAVVQKFHELEGKYEAAMLTVLNAAWLSGESKPNNVEASIAKAKGGSAVREVTQGCIEILGPMGISRDHLLEKWFRDVRITDIYEGTGQVQNLIIARNILEYDRTELK